MVKTLQSHGVNPALSKELARSINAVSRNVKSATSSFDMVQRIISDPALRAPGNREQGLTKLQTEWSTIQKVNYFARKDFPD